MLTQSLIDLDEVRRMAQLSFASVPNAAQRKEWSQARIDAWIGGWVEGWLISAIQACEKRLRRQVTPVEQLEKLSLAKLIRMAGDCQLQCEQHFSIDEDPSWIISA